MRSINSKGKTEMKEVTITRKKTVTEIVANLEEDFSDKLRKIKIHYFNNQHQSQEYRYLKSSLQKNEAIIHVDFAENYLCKTANAIQSAHFGAPQAQITLHTGVCYTGPDMLSHCFCTVSDSLEHGPVRI